MIAPRTTIDPDILDAVVRGWAANTRRAFSSDLSLWSEWCRQNKTDAAKATPKLVAAWIRALSGMEESKLKTRKPATIERYLVNVGRAYRLMELEDPTKAALVSFERRAMKRVLGVKQTQAKGIRFKGDIADLDSPPKGICIAHLLAACRRDALGKRDAALLRIAYDTGCRRSELVAIECRHIEGPESDGAGVLFIPSSKTDQASEGQHAYLSPAAMKAIFAWQKRMKINSGPLFRRVYLHFDRSVDRLGSEPLHPNSITLIYRRLARRAFDKGLLGSMGRERFERELRSLSSHSIRVGVAQDNFALGESLPAIMQAYRWRDSRTVMRYGAKLATRSGASARLAKRFADD
ncbi:tyrosine-type recombinase/integrase [uncultured Erythrobacter sp.]|uniref:tyrosine-type recombinase/integrase n=1 Tax=uncultured Erythrobacter sp. TaxID=263913 RepID=UPI002623BF40|nr:tyrosine-type recombinase/integrase [uncultured Erythrobacter sp.]